MKLSGLTIFILTGFEILLIVIGIIVGLGIVIIASRITYKYYLKRKKRVRLTEDDQDN